MNTPINRRPPAQDHGLTQLPPSSSMLHWNKDSVKLLLRYPARLMQEDLWRHWVQQRGGLGSIYCYLQAQPLSEADRKLLHLLIENPRDSASIYAQTLKISRSVYFQRLDRLLVTLGDYLNAWDLLLPYPKAENNQASAGVVKPLVSPLPNPLTSLIGREQDLLELQTMILQPHTRLVTLTGAGGVGKTRLAIQLAQLVSHHFDTCCFVSLEVLDDPDLVLPTIGQHLGIKESGLEVLTAISSMLANGRYLLVIDTIEHLPQIGSYITVLLEACSGLNVILTSRHLVHVYGEHQYHVSGLPLPALDDDLGNDQLTANPSVALILDRAAAVNRQFQLTADNARAIITLCQQLDGIPLALELAAEQLKWFHPQQLCDQLKHGMDWLQSEQHNRPKRQQTLHNSIEWSYTLLSPHEQVIFARLGVFMDCFTLKELAAIGMLDHETPQSMLQPLLALVEKNMLQLVSKPLNVPSNPGVCQELWGFRLGVVLQRYALDRLAEQHQEQEAEFRTRYEYYLSHHAQTTTPTIEGNTLSPT